MAETRAWWCPGCDAKCKVANDATEDELTRLRQDMETLKATTESAVRLLREKDAELARLRNGRERTSFSLGEPLPSSTAKRISVTDDCELSQSQIAARQAVKSELPTFSGDPEGWPLFLSTFRRSTRTFGFSEDENILRLQSALRGKALRMVQSRLRHTDHLDEIIDALEKAYGRADVLVNTLLEQIREAPPIKTEKLDSFIEFGELVAEICATVKSSGNAERLYDASSMQELVDRMPAYLRWSWGMHSLELKRITLTEFSAWVQKATDGAMAVTPPQPKKKASTRQVHAQHVESHVVQNSKPRACMICDSDSCNTIAECTAFNKLSVSARWDKVRSLKLCKRCLGKHYGSCHVHDECGLQGCVAKHHRKLHRVTGEERKAEVNHHGTGTDHTLLRYVPVKLHGERGPIYTYALLDEGSTVTLMEQGLARQMGVHGVPDPMCLQYSAGQRRDERESERVTVKVSGIQASASVYPMANVRTVGKLSLPSQSVNTDELKQKFEHLKAIPAPSYKDVSPRMLIGIDHYRLTRPLKTIEGKSGQPTATKTRLGWLIFGMCTDRDNEANIVQPESSYHICDCQGVTSKADRMMAAYFEVEGYGPAKPPLLSKEDQRAMALLKTSTRHIDGRYTTGLLWRADNVFMPENRHMALSRLKCLERKMNEDKHLAEEINRIIKDYVTKGYVRQVTDEELKTFYPKKWYLPVFPVTNPNKPKKIRLVWDAAAEVRGVSLNKKLLTGPDLLTPLQAVLFRFREYKIGVAADIREMYHQVQIDGDDIHSQRFLWRWGNTNVEPQEYVMLRMTFGAACSPCTAQYVKNENAEQYRSQYPRAVQCVTEEHYVDDLLTSVETESEATELAHQVPLHESSLQLHVFVDAGSDGYAAVAYFRFEYKGKIEVVLVGAKARVAPLKYLSVPKLELQAAVMGCRLATAIANAHRQTIQRYRFWTDSTDVIDWINADHRKYSIFVAHRIAEVLETTSKDEWRWVPTTMNVADEATKWTNLKNHLASKRWFHGPEFLHLPEAEWDIPQRMPSETREEMRKKKLPKLVGTQTVRQEFIAYERFSRWTRLVRTVAYVCRYVNIVTNANPLAIGSLTHQEVQAAEKVIVRDVQRNVFPDEYALLKKHRDNPTVTSWKGLIPRNSSLFKRNPYMDEEGLLRLCGRIDRCRFVDASTKRPIILPRQHYVTELIVDDIHRKYKHGCQETVVNELRQRYDIPALRSVCRRVRSHCRTCMLLYTQPVTPQMCELPAARLAAFSQPFSYTGVDYFGPLLVTNGRRTEKRWGVLFTCLTVRAVHIEVVRSLCTSDCLMAVRSFMARRGIPTEIISDRGTNFVGADRELKEAAERVNTAILSEFGPPDPAWKFNPPAAPHFGGSWERMIQSVKRMLARTLMERHPTEAVLTATLIEVENMNETVG
ncbi:uncharacterized protein LOC128718201 [Anopheles marshallii]|uniref:uncharacterized protein LOC128718201 n=1 Tax=Anopheles marshallii TaxID=1521116 RepID=UPI00237A4503|nr:uncharacterized protein LOC128718201 [Anopheles marshallii]